MNILHVNERVYTSIYLSSRMINDKINQLLSLIA